MSAKDNKACCFCGKGIDYNLSDPIIIRLGGNKYLTDYDKERQMLFAHVACLGKALHPSVVFLETIFYDEDELN